MSGPVVTHLFRWIPACISIQAQLQNHTFEYRCNSDRTLLTYSFSMVCTMWRIYLETLLHLNNDWICIQRQIDHVRSLEYGQRSSLYPKVLRTGLMKGLRLRDQSTTIADGDKVDLGREGMALFHTFMGDLRLRTRLGIFNKLAVDNLFQPSFMDQCTGQIFRTEQNIVSWHSRQVETATTKTPIYSISVDTTERNRDTAPRMTI